MSKGMDDCRGFACTRTFACKASTSKVMVRALIVCFSTRVSTQQHPQTLASTVPCERSHVVRSLSNHHRERIAILVAPLQLVDRFGHARIRPDTCDLVGSANFHWRV